MLAAYLKGFGMGAGLIVAIGAQNAHVLRMGLRRQHVAMTVLVCIVCEVLMISSGIAGIGALVDGDRLLAATARRGGAVFLMWYGLRAWRSALQAQSLDIGPQRAAPSRRQALATVLAVTLLNPHAWLDTVILLGAVGSQQGPQGKWWFALGAMHTAMLWFALLGFGARLLSPWFAKPSAWRVLDGLVGTVMLLLAVLLIV